MEFVKKNSAYIVFAFIMFLPLLLSAQPGNPGGGGGTDPDGVPIDGGISWLAAAGAAYGIKKFRDSRKK